MRILVVEDDSVLAAALTRALNQSTYAVAPGATLAHGRVRLDVAARRLFHDDEPIEMSARELALTELFLSRQGRVVSKEQMIDHLFGFGDDVGSNAIAVYVHRVRRKLEPLGIEIRTVRGMGYLLDKAR